MVKLDFGSRQAKRLCQMTPKDRLNFIADGLPIILESARGFWNAAGQLTAMPREAEVLESFAEEEAAKIFILLDAVRCPPKIASARLGAVIKHFYDHMARLLYAAAQSWKPMHVAQLREYIDTERKAHYLEGNGGEYILPNSTTARRESLLYADIEAYESGEPIWNTPTGFDSGFPRLMPTVLQVAEALSALGIFSQKGLQATADIWGQLDFKDTENHTDAARLTKELLTRLINEELPSETATQDHVNLVYGSWQLPMYNLDLRELDVPLDELHRQREAMMWSEYGEWP